MSSVERRSAASRTSVRAQPTTKKPAKSVKAASARAVVAFRKSTPDVVSAAPASRAGIAEKFVFIVKDATPLQMVEIERQGVAGNVVKAMAKSLDLPAMRVFDMLGLPKATVEKKAAAGDVLVGSGGQAAIGMAKLIGIAEDIADHSTAPEAKGFNAARWLGQWLEQPQPSLGGRKPSEFLDTPTGVEIVARLLGSAESGAYL